jgi:hypothetical protein
MAIETKETKLVKVLNFSEAEQMQMQQAVRNLNPEFLHTAVDNALTTFASRIAEFENSSDPKVHQKAVTSALELLNAVADCSPDCRTRMGDLYKASAQEVLNDAAKVAQLKELFAQLTQTEALQQMHLDITNTMATAMTRANAEQEAYTQRLKDKLKNSPHMQEAIDEHEHLTSKAISSKRDNAMFDPLRVIGHLFAVLIHMHFIVAVEDEFYPLGFKHEIPKNDEFLDLNREMFANTDVLPGAMPAMQQALPPGLKVGV